MKPKKIALIGNPNVGKSTLFNLLTGLRQKIGNYPGMTVEKKTGSFSHEGKKYDLVDLPGTYGLYANSLDEQVVTDVLNNPNHPQHPDLAIVVAEPSNLKRALLLQQQVRDLGIPTLFVVNMMDEAEKQGIKIHLEKLEEKLQTKILLTDARTGKGVAALKNALENPIPLVEKSFSIPREFVSIVEKTKEISGTDRDYQAWQMLTQKEMKHLSEKQKLELDGLKSENKIISKRLQVKEILNRYETIDEILDQTIAKTTKKTSSFSEKIDQILIHPILGYLLFFGLLLLIFQAIFAWSGPFMDGIDEGFAWLSQKVANWLPEGPVSGLITDGIISGIGGIVIFVPQIVILFLFISIMEESGYMSRVVYLMDRWLKPFGLSGKSAVPLMSGAACAIPAVMSARNIENDKERLITILVTPFMTCAARLPIYVVIIGLIIPEEKIYGFNLQGLALLGMYVLGILGALGSAWILKKLIKSKFKSYLVLELPTYRMPVWRNVLLTVWEKSTGFVLGAGKIILAISIILWVLGTFGMGERFNNAEKIVKTEKPNLSDEELENEITAYKLEYSFLGYMGQAIEPLVEPLGYDWKMGIGLISSFAAREVFVGTMATVYSLGDTDDELTIRERMAKEINPNTGKPAYNLASGISLLLFYAFAMQCMATIAIVRKETDSWKWTFVQMIFMTGMAYFAALIAYQILK
ncbi:ferrous iron transport protein B [Moheibacter lacus]|uniref:Ferrous iron transport protein B n=1 Tax=Moheibacter lacus TaxID=2745851 RepID=A0A838ZLH8_9FLAO|nr:ferrous iron transport protein B [Moheibacter lacus]MBA5629334.1 ferrous iron transport protein B [Moheibacter lacus]